MNEDFHIFIPYLIASSTYICVENVSLSQSGYDDLIHLFWSKAAIDFFLQIFNG